MFLRQTTVGREPLAAAMSGARIGERLLQIGMDTQAVTGALAAKPGLSGESSMIVTDDATAVRARRAAEQAGALLNIRVHTLDELPYGDGSFDLVVVHNRDSQLSGLDTSLQSRILVECLRTLRPGGRVVVLDKGSPTGFAAMFQSRKVPDRPGTTQRTLEAAGFRAVRPLGDREGYSFVEGMKLG